MSRNRVNGAVGLDKEALVAGMPELIEMATAQAGIRQPERGFVEVRGARIETLADRASRADDGRFLNLH